MAKEMVRSPNGEMIVLPRQLLATGGTTILIALGLVLTGAAWNTPALWLLGAAIITVTAATFVLIGWGVALRPSKN